MSRSAKKLVRVTEVLSFVEAAWKEWWWRSVGFEAADKITRDSSKFGTQVHEIVEATLLNKASPHYGVEQALCAGKIIEYLKSNDVLPLFNTFEESLEIEVKDEGIGLIGHFDFAGTIDGVPYIIDFKTSNKMRKSFPLQKAAYAKMVEKQFGVKVNNGITVRSHWDKQTQEVVFETKKYERLIEDYWPKFQSALEVYQYFK